MMMAMLQSGLDHHLGDGRAQVWSLGFGPEGLPAIEEAIFRGIPINVTLLFSVEDYLAAADAYLRGIERRVAAGLDPSVGSVASLFISRWDAAVAATVPADLRGTLALAIGQQTYRASCELLASDRFQRLAAAGARPQRLLFASTSINSSSINALRLMVKSCMPSSWPMRIASGSL